MPSIMGSEKCIRERFKTDDETKEEWYQRCKEKALTSRLLGGKIHGKKIEEA